MAAPAETGEWLALVDQGRYGQSRVRTGSYFRSRIDQNDWVDEVGAVRGPLGAVTSRTLVSVQHMTSLPDAPNGVYAVVTDRTGIANKGPATETITMVGENEDWRAVGYVIR
jgi:hypothetical protein